MISPAVDRVGTTKSLFDFFHDAIRDARPADRRRLSDETALYLAQMLADRARTDRVAPTAETLVELHASASQARPAEQARTWRELGDRALYDLGFFRERVEHGVVGADYYETMGSAAYQRVHHVLERWFASAFGNLFADLSTDFHDCVAVVTRVRKAHDPGDELGVLYDRWLATGDEETASDLRRRGLILPRSRPGDGGAGS